MISPVLAINRGELARGIMFCVALWVINLKFVKRDIEKLVKRWEEYFPKNRGEAQLLYYFLANGLKDQLVIFEQEVLIGGKPFPYKFNHSWEFASATEMEINIISPAIRKRIETLQNIIMKKMNAIDNWKNFDLRNDQILILFAEAFSKGDLSHISLFEQNYIPSWKMVAPFFNILLCGTAGNTEGIPPMVTEVNILIRRMENGQNIKNRSNYAVQKLFKKFIAIMKQRNSNSRKGFFNYDKIILGEASWELPAPVGVPGVYTNQPTYSVDGQITQPVNISDQADNTSQPVNETVGQVNQPMEGPSHATGFVQPFYQQHFAQNQVAQPMGIPYYPTNGFYPAQNQPAASSQAMQPQGSTAGSFYQVQQPVVSYNQVVPQATVPYYPTNQAYPTLQQPVLHNQAVQPQGNTANGFYQVQQVPVHNSVDQTNGVAYYPTNYGYQTQQLPGVQNQTTKLQEIVSYPTSYGYSSQQFGAYNQNYQSVGIPYYPTNYKYSISGQPAPMMQMQYQPVPQQQFQHPMAQYPENQCVQLPPTQLYNVPITTSSNVEGQVVKENGEMMLEKKKPNTADEHQSSTSSSVASPNTVQIVSIASSVSSNSAGLSPPPTESEMGIPSSTKSDSDVNGSLNTADNETTSLKNEHEKLVNEQQLSIRLCDMKTEAGQMAPNESPMVSDSDELITLVPEVEITSTSSIKQIFAVERELNASQNETPILIATNHNSANQHCSSTSSPAETSEPGTMVEHTASKVTGFSRLSDELKTDGSSQNVPLEPRAMVKDATPTDTVSARQSRETLSDNGSQAVKKTSYATKAKLNTPGKQSAGEEANGQTFDKKPPPTTVSKNVPLEPRVIVKNAVPVNTVPVRVPEKNKRDAGNQSGHAKIAKLTTPEMQFAKVETNVRDSAKKQQPATKLQNVSQEPITLVKNAISTVTGVAKLSNEVKPVVGNQPVTKLNTSGKQSAHVNTVVRKLPNTPESALRTVNGSLKAVTKSPSICATSCGSTNLSVVSKQGADSSWTKIVGNKKIKVVEENADLREIQGEVLPSEQQLSTSKSKEFSKSERKNKDKAPETLDPGSLVCSETDDKGETEELSETPTTEGSDSEDSGTEVPSTSEASSSNIGQSSSNSSSAHVQRYKKKTAKKSSKKGPTAEEQKIKDEEDKKAIEEAMATKARSIKYDQIRIRENWRMSRDVCFIEYQLKTTLDDELAEKMARCFLKKRIEHFENLPDATESDLLSLNTYYKMTNLTQEHIMNLCFLHKSLSLTMFSFYETVFLEEYNAEMEAEEEFQKYKNEKSEEVVEKEKTNATLGSDVVEESLSQPT